MAVFPLYLFPGRVYLVIIETVYSLNIWKNAQANLPESGVILWFISFFYYFGFFKGFNCILDFFTISQCIFSYVQMFKRAHKTPRDLKTRNIMWQEREDAVTHCKSEEYSIHKLPLDLWSISYMLCPQCEPPHLVGGDLAWEISPKKVSISLYMIKSALSNWLGHYKPE